MIWVFTTESRQALPLHRLNSFAFAIEQLARWSFIGLWAAGAWSCVPFSFVHQLNEFFCFNQHCALVLELLSNQLASKRLKSKCTIKKSFTRQPWFQLISQSWSIVDEIKRIAGKFVNRNLFWFCSDCRWKKKKTRSVRDKPRRFSFDFIHSR